MTEKETIEMLKKKTISIIGKLSFYSVVEKDKELRQVLRFAIKCCKENEELRKKIDHLKGIKFHPDMQSWEGLTKERDKYKKIVGNLPSEEEMIELIIKTGDKHIEGCRKIGVRDIILLDFRTAIIALKDKIAKALFKRIWGER